MQYTYIALIKKFSLLRNSANEDASQYKKCIMLNILLTTVFKSMTTFIRYNRDMKNGLFVSLYCTQQMNLADNSIPYINHSPLAQLHISDSAEKSFNFIYRKMK
ncbi:hypothetical protein AB672_00785 [Xylella taiwanensis]|nr:hypothetical protein AB672_00785 [Xylella taiwanensis]